MARDDNERLFNGSAAYQLYSDFESTAAPEIQHPDLPQERPRHKKVRRVKVKTAVSPVAVVGLLAVTCMLILVVFGYVQLYEASEEVSSLQSELSELQERQVVLQSLYEEGIDLDYVEDCVCPPRSRPSISISPAPTRRRSTPRSRQIFSSGFSRPLSAAPADWWNTCPDAPYNDTSPDEAQVTFGSNRNAAWMERAGGLPTCKHSPLLSPRCLQRGFSAVCAGRQSRPAILLFCCSVRQSMV